jgi:predicted DNA-binding protein with PD1-like motif
MNAVPSSIRSFVFRLKPKADLKKSIQEFARQNQILAGSIVTVVGSLEQFHIRFANKPNGVKRSGFFEIVSLVGTFSPSWCHLHVVVSDENGQTFGGHLLDDNLIYTTAEIVVTDLVDLEFSREVDNTYGYHELIVGIRNADS